MFGLGDREGKEEKRSFRRKIDVEVVVKETDDLRGSREYVDVML